MVIFSVFSDSFAVIAPSPAAENHLSTIHPDGNTELEGRPATRLGNFVSYNSTFYLTSPFNDLLGLVRFPAGLVRHRPGDPGRRLRLGGIGLQAGRLGPETLGLGRQVVG